MEWTVSRVLSAPPSASPVAVGTAAAGGSQSGGGPGAAHAWGAPLCFAPHATEPLLALGCGNAVMIYDTLTGAGGCRLGVQPLVS